MTIKHDGVDDRLGDGAADAARAAAGDKPLMAGDHPDDERETEALEHAVGHVFRTSTTSRRLAEEGLKGDVDPMVHWRDTNAPPSQPTRMAKITSNGSATAMATRRGSTR